ncbi:MAG: ABC transporter ATP-binding protein, partial [Fimbriimonas ginsengisoli]|nr:ABC transporter ATP-binding protein [Fimbriimonas ginsengisoli]
SLQVAEGEFLILVGLSGCGKSTLLNIVAGLDQADSGRVKISGRPVSGPGRDRAMVFQDGALFPWLTAAQNVEFALRQRGLGAGQCRLRAREYLDLVHLGDFADAHVHQLSGGMRQRVAIARALALEPEVLLMDEPFSALDAQTREELYVELQRIWLEAKATILFVTHNTREAVTLGDRVVLLRRPNGRPSVQGEFPITILRPREIDDTDVAEMAKRIAIAMRDGRDLAELEKNHEDPPKTRRLLRGDNPGLGRSIGG